MRAAAALAALLLAAGCASVRAPSPAEPPAPRVGEVQSGIASWYGHPHHGRRTASGETYDMTMLTAAHRTLPFGTVVAVTNARSGASVEVRINDRGPHVAGRIIDLSYEAARRIGLVGEGIGPVRLRVVSRPDAADGVAGAPMVPGTPVLPVTPASAPTDPPAARPAPPAPASRGVPAAPR
jgi:rare lipoprotein A